MTLFTAIQREHADIPGGRLDSRGGQSELIIKTMGEVTTLREMGEIVISRNGKAAVRLKDVAEIADGLEDERSYSELNGKTWGESGDQKAVGHQYRRYCPCDQTRTSQTCYRNTS
jgi:multidrug efflux pump subunit AcrB